MSSTQPLLIGAHTSAAGGAHRALIEGKQIGATTIQLFTSNQKRWEGKPLSDEALLLWKKTLEETDLRSIMSHDSYLINLGAPDPEVLRKSRAAFKEELHRCFQLEISFLNFHPGAALKDPVDTCLDRIVESLLELEPLFDGKHTTRLLLEATAGQGSCVGCKFEQLDYIVKRVKKQIPIGVCIDTCHIFAAGYDIRTKEALDLTLQEFDETVGIEHLYALHLNDSLKGLGSRVDRHQPLGKGEIGLACFQAIVNHPKLCQLPMYLETPDGPPLWEKEIQMLRSFQN